MFNTSVRRAMRAAAQAAAAASLVVLVAGQVQAQTPVTKDQQPPAGGGGGRGMGGGRMMQMMKDSLNLSAAQSAQVDSINTAFMAKMQAGGDRQQIMQDRTAAIKAVLNADQAKKYDAMMEAMRNRQRPPAGR